MVRSGWKQRVTNEVVASIEGAQRRDGEAQSRYEYEIRLPVGRESSADIHPIGQTRLLRTRWSADETGVLRLLITIPDESTVERFAVQIGKAGTVVYLPSPDFLDAVQAASAGEEEAASSILDAFDSPVQLPVICGTFLSVSDVLDLVAGVTEVSRHASSYLHSYRYGIVRAALTSNSGLTVRSYSGLEALIRGLDSIGNIGPVDILDALGDVMATLYDTPAEMNSLLDALGADRRAVERRDDGFFFLCYLAHFVEAEGIEAAEGHAMTRHWWIHGNYERRVFEARNVEFSERGTAWRRLLCEAARQDRQDFAYVLANACYWSAKERQSDSRVSGHLLSGAIAAAQEINLEHVESRARFERRLDIAHRLRSSHNYKPALPHFRAAERLAQTYDYLPTWRVRYGRGICQAHALVNAGDADAAVNTLTDTIDAVLQFDVEGDRLTTITHHLTAQKHEILGDSNESPSETYEHYEAASNHFDIIDFDRSQKRCARKRARVKTHLKTQNDTTAVSESSNGSRRDAMTAESEEPSTDQSAQVSEGFPPEVQAAKTGFYPPPPANAPSQAEPHELGNPDPGVLSKEDDEPDDPYLF